MLRLKLNHVSKGDPGLKELGIFQDQRGTHNVHDDLSK